MKMGTPLLAVRDLQASLAFYREVLGLELVSDYGANVVLTGGISLQTLETWAGFLDMGSENVIFGGNAGEIYFVAEDFDAFLKVLKDHPEAELVRPPLEHRWGQRVVRLYDPDRHIIEVGENMRAVCRRFRDQGMAPEQIAARMEVPLKFVTGCLR